MGTSQTRSRSGFLLTVMAMLRSYDRSPVAATQPTRLAESRTIFRLIVVVIVRREKALDFSGCDSRPGTGSLHPVAIEAAVALTKLSELSMERVPGRPREGAGHNVSER